MGKVLILVTILFSFACFAEDCEFRDFTPELGAIRYQWRTGWCFANAAADLATQKTHLRISAAAVAASFFAVDPQVLYASAHLTIQAYLRHHPDFLDDLAISRENGGDATHADAFVGLLSTSAPENDFSARGVLGDKGVMNLGGTIDHALFLANADPLCSESEMPSDEAHVLGLFKEATARFQAAQDHDRACLAHPLDETSPIADQGAVYLLGIYSALAHSHCAHRKSVPLIPQHWGARSSDELFELARGRKEKIPLYQDSLILLMNKAMDEKRVVALGIDGNKLDPAAVDLKEAGDHATVIAGREKVDGQCRYKMRNSWGESCDLTEPFKSRCVKGYTWVTAEELKRMTLYSVDYLL